MPSLSVDLPDSPPGYSTDIHRTIAGTEKVVRFRVEFSPMGPRVVAASKEEGVLFTSVSIVGLPPFTSSSKQSEVLATLQYKTIAYFHGKVHFLPEPYTYYRNWKTELENPSVSKEVQKELQYRIDQVAPEAEAVRILLGVEGGSEKLKSLPLLGKWVSNAENELLLPTIALAYEALGLKYDSLLSYEASLVCYQHVLDLAIRMNHTQLKRAAYCNLGLGYQHLGDPRMSIECYGNALKIAEQTNNLEGQVNVYLNLGIAYYNLSAYRKAIEWWEKALQIAEQTNDHENQGKAYNNLGNGYSRLGDYWKAIEFHNKRITVEQQTGNLKAEHTSYNNLGTAYNKLGNYRTSIECFNKALKIAEQTKDLAGQGSICANLGTAYDSLREYGTAIDFHLKALMIAEETNHLDTMVGAYRNLGTVYSRFGDHETAIDYHKKCIEVVEKTGDLYAQQLSYNNLGNVYKRKKECQLAIQAYKKSVEISEKLLKNNTEETLQTQIAFFETFFHSHRGLEESYTLDLATLSTTNPLREALLLADRGRSRALLGVLEKEAGGVREPFSVKQMQDVAAKHQTTLLLYSFSTTEETKAWVWVIPSKGEITHRFLDLTPMQEEMKAKEIRPGHLQTVRGNQDDAFLEVTSWVTRSPWVPAEAEVLERNKVTRLWYQCLIEPIKEQLPQDSGARLTLVLDTAMVDLPFSLFEEETGETLLERYTISIAPSIETLALLDALDQRRADTRNLDQACIVANPEGSWLMGAEKEGKAVAKFFKQAELLTGGRATLTNVKQALPTASFIHFACHSQTVDNDKNPVKKTPSSVFQGSLQLANSQQLFSEDFVETPLNAKLAVLGGCFSGRGALLKEGAVGPLHALLAAGASTAIGTRWAIDDQATRLIFETFYHFYFNETPESRKAQAEGRPFGAAEALREALLFAKQEVAIGNLDSPDPYDPDFRAAWGAFFLVGLPGK